MSADPQPSPAQASLGVRPVLGGCRSGGDTVRPAVVGDAALSPEGRGPSVETRRALKADDELGEVNPTRNQYARFSAHTKASFLVTGRLLTGLRTLGVCPVLGTSVLGPRRCSSARIMGLGEQRGATSPEGDGSHAGADASRPRQLKVSALPGGPAPGAGVMGKACSAGPSWGPVLGGCGCRMRAALSERSAEIVAF